ncbi:hypothetical protein DXA92_16275 [Agathobaculum butyriciproducens]|nr:hypothetical protein DXA92_16275 [Agathobaculum butyriciproducens]
MKKLTAMLLALMLCFGLAACGGNTAQDDTKDESQTVQTGKTEDKKDEAKTEEKSDEAKTEDAKTETDDKTSTDSKTEDKTNENKPVTSSTNTTTAKPSASASTSKPSASTSKPAASAPASKPAQSKPAASAPAETNRRTGEGRLPLRRAGTSARPHPHSRAHSAHRHPRAIRRAAWAKVRTASGRMTGLPFIPIKRAVRRLSKRFNKLAVSNRRYGFMFRRGGQWPPFFTFRRGKIKGQTDGLPYGR